VREHGARHRGGEADSDLLPAAARIAPAPPAANVSRLSAARRRSSARVLPRRGKDAEQQDGGLKTLVAATQPGGQPVVGGKQSGHWGVRRRAAKAAINEPEERLDGAEACGR
jgi:hypothetical protein